MPFTVRPYRRVPCAMLTPVKRLLLVTLLVLSCEPVYAEWVAVGRSEDGHVIVYADANTLRRKGELVKLWELLDYKTAQTKPNEEEYLSIRMQHEYDCVEELHRVLAFGQFTGNMGQGEIVSSGAKATEWEPIVPESIWQIIWKTVCGK